MFATNTVLTFFLTACLLAIAPGPDNIYVLSQAATRGARAGFAVILGLCTGLVGHTSAVALGLAALFAASPLALSLLQVGGACYLLYLAYGAWRAEGELELSEGSTAGYWRLYGRGVLLNISNPKVSLFFLALLPQFADPTRASLALQLFALGGLFAMATLVVFGAIALLGGWLSQRWARSHSSQRWLNRISAGVFVALAIPIFIQALG